MVTEHDLDREKARRRAARRREDPEWHERRKEQMRRASFRRRFGLTWDEYQQMFEDRDGLCDICNNPETRTRHGRLLPLCVDHDEISGQIRGLLCSNCNVGLGMLNHDVERLKKAIHYLRKVKH